MICRSDTFYTDIKNLIGFRVIIWERVKPVPYLEGSEIAKNGPLVNIWEPPVGEPNELTTPFVIADQIISIYYRLM